MHYRTCSWWCGVTEPFRMERTSGGPKSSIQLKAVSTLNSNQVAQGFIWLSLKTFRDADVALSLRNLLILLYYIQSELLFLNNILWDPPHGNLYLLSIVLMPHTFLITFQQIPVDLETVFSNIWNSQLFLRGGGTSPWESLGNSCTWCGLFKATFFLLGIPG